MGFGNVFTALWAAIVGLLGAVAKFGVAAENLGDTAVHLTNVAKETSAQYEDDAREQRKLNLRRLQAERLQQERIIEAEEQKLLPAKTKAKAKEPVTVVES